MRKISAFNFLSLNGFYKGPLNDISWHTHGSEESEFSAESLKAGNTLLFGRITYEMMVDFWTSPLAHESLPVVAAGMNDSRKIVFSNTMKKADWQNSEVISGDIVAAVKKMKAAAGSNMTILGSGSIITLFADNDLIDEYQIMIDPVALGEGTSLFRGLQQKLHLRLTGTRVFKSGVVLLDYVPQK